MEKDPLMWAYDKFRVALPVIVVLVLAHCGSGGEDPAGSSTAEQATEADSAGGKAEPDYSAEQIRAALELLEKSEQESRGREYSAEDIKAAMREHIARRTELGKPGVFEITDARTSRTLRLQFQKIDDPVRSMPGGFYFACTNFGVDGQPEKTFDLDFWLQEHDGELKVYQENVHKVPVRKDGEWVQDPHYNFVDDRINLLP